VVLGFLLFSLLGFGALADRALLGQVRAAREAAASQADETARLTALSVRAALAQLEQALAAGHPPDGVAVEQLPKVPSRSARLSRKPYGQRPRAELAKLLRSTDTTEQGLPEAVVARLALGDEARVVGAADEATTVAERLLSGRLPVRPEDLPALAHSLGVGQDPRMALLQRRLREAPAADGLPELPAFRRRLLASGRIEGWSRSSGQRLGYQVAASDLLVRAGVADRAGLPTSAHPASGSRQAVVPDVDGLALEVIPYAPEALRLQGLRAALWAAIGACGVGLFLVRRGLAREARAVDQERRFLAGVTHELRTPLAAIRLFGETLAEGRGDPREYGTLIAAESGRLDALVESVLAATRLTEAPAFTRLDPRGLVASALVLVTPRAERRSISLVSTPGPPLPEVEWDADAVRRALLNLLDNAIKHGHAGGRVEVRAESDADWVKLSVADDGPGIGRRDRTRVFGRFERGERAAPGSGLGLHLVDQVASAHGGRVELETEEGRGSTFTLCLPHNPPRRTA
jgi:signal transduction histidine kinase